MTQIGSGFSTDGMLVDNDVQGIWHRFTLLLARVNSAEIIDITKQAWSSRRFINTRAEVARLFDRTLRSRNELLAKHAAARRPVETNKMQVHW